MNSNNGVVANMSPDLISENTDLRRSPFHTGEKAIQNNLGFRDNLEAIGRRVIRPFMPEQHRQFFSQLPYVVLATVDEQGRPWASILFNQPGFMTSPDPNRLDICAPLIQGDPSSENLSVGSDIGILGIEFQTRRRNRMNGTIESKSEDSFTVRVKQSFGNCPQYIQQREISVDASTDDRNAPLVVNRGNKLGGQEKELIATSDTFFIASYYNGDGREASSGVDVSHRGGKPGFVRLEGDNTLVFPDFAGNRHFNTLGNLLVNPLAGLLFVDFNGGDLIYLTGSTDIIWSGNELQSFQGAERLVKFVVTEVIRISNGMPLTWRFNSFSPALINTGIWQNKEQSMNEQRQENQFRDFNVIRVDRESETITSFYLEPLDGDTLSPYKPGQHLPLQLDIPGHRDSVNRTYTLSDKANSEYYRLSIKREPAAGPDLPPGLVSNYFHEQVNVGSVIRAKNPQGTFFLDTETTRPVALLSAGVGLTPMISMLNHIAKDHSDSGSNRNVWFIHGTRNSREHAFKKHVKSLSELHPNIKTHICYSRADTDDREGEDFDSRGYVDIDLIRRLLYPGDFEFYLCGPTQFMASLYTGLIASGVPKERIHYEFFGPAQSFTDESVGAADISDRDPVPVLFSLSDKRAIWDPDKGFLLDLAESEGLFPPFGCRSGNCGTCATRILSGDVEYPDAPTAEVDDGEALICCSIPKEARTPEDSEKKAELVLEI